MEVFTTQRERLLKAYASKGQEVIAHTIPYHSTGILRFTVVDAADPIAFAVARANQKISFFSYGVGGDVYLGGSGTVQATEAETNLSKGRQTNGGQDFVIEGVGFSCRGARIAYAGASLTALQALTADSDVEAALIGNEAMYDPAAVLLPPQVQSPFNLENGMFQALLDQASVEFTFDRKRVEKIGTLGLLPQAGGQSYLRSNGSPECTNRYAIPEGYIWMRDGGGADCDFEASVVLQNPVVVPISLTSLWSGANSGDAVTPSYIYLEVQMRLYGLAVDLPSRN